MGPGQDLFFTNDSLKLEGVSDFRNGELSSGYRMVYATYTPILVRITGVTTVRRFPSSAKFVEFPVAGKSFPLRKAMSWSLYTESSAGLMSLFCFSEKREGGSWIEASTIVFWKYAEKEKEKSKVTILVWRSQNSVSSCATFLITRWKHFLKVYVYTNCNN